MMKSSKFFATSVRNITFECGMLKLAGTLHRPPGRVKAVVVGCHGMLANRMSAKQIALARACAKEKIAYFRFDHRGCGQSHGEIFLPTLLHDRCRDLEAALKVARQLLGDNITIGLFGSSFGATVALSMAAEKGIKPVVAVAAPVKLQGISQATIKSLQQQHPGFSTSHAKSFNFDITGSLGKISNLLVIHGALDQVVPVENAHAIFERAQNPKELVIIDGSDHGFSRRKDQMQLVRLAQKWLASNFIQSNQQPETKKIRANCLWRF